MEKKLTKELIVDEEVKELMSPIVTDLYLDNTQKVLDSELEKSIFKDVPLFNQLKNENKNLKKTVTEFDKIIRTLNELRSEDAEVIDALNYKYIETLNNLEAMQGELNRIDKQPNPCECPDKISKLEAKVQRLESNLSIEKHNNHDLINHINTLQVYKSKYFKTVETLKVHLPN